MVMSHADRVIVELLVVAPIDTVWRALREPDQIRRWFGWEHAGLAEEIAMMFPRDAASDATYTRQIPGMSDRFVLEALGSGHTVVRVIRAAPVADAGWTGIYDDAIEGWLTFAHQLRFMLERHATGTGTGTGVTRRTLFLNGRAKQADTPLPEEALGLTSVRVVPIGARYRATTAMGDTLEGFVWHRSPYQVGLTVDAYGDGLLVVTTRTRTAKSAHGGGTIGITTYGLDDQALAALGERWSAWWRDRYEVIQIEPESQRQQPSQQPPPQSQASTAAGR
jgi:hypothetical protein